MSPNAFPGNFPAGLIAAIVLYCSATAAISQNTPETPAPLPRLESVMRDCIPHDPKNHSGRATDMALLAIELDDTGEYTTPPMAIGRGYSAGDRALYRKAMEALRKCLPVSVGNRVVSGAFVLRITPTDVHVETKNAALVQREAVKPLAKDFLDVPRSASGSVIQDNATDATERALNLKRKDRKEMQQRLKILGHDPKGTDGVFGKNSRRAISAWQRESTLTPTGYLNHSQIDAIRGESETGYQEWLEKERRKPRRRRVKVCQRILGGLALSCRYEWR